MTDSSIAGWHAWAVMMDAPAPGWYPDPLDATRERYWNGTQWSAGTRECSAEPPGVSTAPTHQGRWVQKTPESTGSASAPAAAGVVSATGLPPLASWGRRAIAMVLDSLLLNVAVVLTTYPFMRSDLDRLQTWFDEAMATARDGSAVPPVPTDIPSPQTSAIVYGALAAATFIYSLLFLRLGRATLGQRALSLRVVDEHAERLTWQASALRSVLWTFLAVGAQLSALLLLLWVLSGLRPLWHPRRQTWPDSFARTFVVIWKQG